MHGVGRERGDPSHNMSESGTSGWYREEGWEKSGKVSPVVKSRGGEQHNVGVKKKKKKIKPTKEPKRETFFKTESVV